MSPEFSRGALTLESRGFTSIGFSFKRYRPIQIISARIGTASDAMNS
jgi:hypothetical protein